MKKVITLLMFFILSTAVLAGCGGKSGTVSEEVYNYGVAVLETCDDFLDGKISNDEAVKRMDNTIESIKDYNYKILKELGVETMVEARFDKNYQFYDDGTVETKSTILKHDINLNKYDGTPTKEQIKNSRDELEKILKN